MLVLGLLGVASCAGARRGRGGSPASPERDASAEVTGDADGGAAVTDAGRPIMPPGAGTDAGHSPPPIDAGSAAVAAGVPVFIEVYSGDGLMTLSGWPGGDPMKVIVTDGGGRGVPGVAVTWTVTSGGGGIVFDGAPGVAVTNENGVSRVGFRGEFLSSSTTTTVTTVRATCAVGSVELHGITVNGGTSGISPGAILVDDETHGRDLGVRAPGEVAVGALEVLAYQQYGVDSGRGIEGVSVRLIAPEDASGGPDAFADGAPAVSCANARNGQASGGMVFTDAAGRALCDVRMPMTPGDYHFNVRVGGAVEHSGGHVTVR